MNYFVLLQSSTNWLKADSPLFLIGGMMLVIYLFFLRPQSKKVKDAKKFHENLQKGDKIVTIAGIHGTINKVNEDGTISLEVYPGSYLKTEKSAISVEWSQQLNKAALVEKK